MQKAHEVADIAVHGATLSMRVDGRIYEIDLAQRSPRLANASQSERNNLEISPAGYGIHWPDVDEDLTIDGLIGACQRLFHG